MTAAQVVALIAAGIAFHSVLPRVWRLVFGEVTVPPSVDNWHAYAASKIVRVTMWFDSHDTESRCLLFCILSAPAEYLLLLLQKRDQAGGLLRDVMLSHQDPFAECLRTYATMLTNPLETLHVLITHFMPQGFDFIWCMFQMLGAFTVGIMSYIWRDLLSYYSSWPYKLVGLLPRNYSGSRCFGELGAPSKKSFETRVK